MAMNLEALAQEVQDFRKQQDACTTEIKDKLGEIDITLKRIEPVLSAHEERFKTIFNRVETVEKEHDNLIVRIWTLAVGVILALVGAALDFMKGGR